MPDLNELIPQTSSRTEEVTTVNPDPTTDTQPEQKDAPEFQEVVFYNPHAGLGGRDGGPYLDQVEREKAELNRARVEQRSADVANATFVTGTPAFTGGQMKANANTNSHPSMVAPVNATSTNDGAEKLPVDVRDSYDGEPTDTGAKAGEPVGSVPGEGEVTNAEGATVNSPLL